MFTGSFSDLIVLFCKGELDVPKTDVHTRSLSHRESLEPDETWFECTDTGDVEICWLVTQPLEAECKETKDDDNEDDPDKLGLFTFPNVKFCWWACTRGTGWIGNDLGVDSGISFVFGKPAMASNGLVRNGIADCKTVRSGLKHSLHSEVVVEEQLFGKGFESGECNMVIHNSKYPWCNPAQ